MQINRKPAEALIHGIKPYQSAQEEAYMGPPQLEHFRAVLNAWLSELSEDTTKTVVHLQDETANHPDPTDRASQETDMALELRGRDRDRKLIKKINESIRHLDSGDFGYCENCGEEIGLKRLEARPTAVLCIDCKTLDEIRERQLS
ncbi:MAG: RNA polymerase-binding protein DksA [Gammaproteobacteria bacterium]